MLHQTTFLASALLKVKGGEIMKITINGNPKEIAALALELQGQHKEEKLQNDDILKKQINLISQASEYCYKRSYVKELCLLSHALIELRRL